MRASSYEPAVVRSVSLADHFSSTWPYLQIVRALTQVTTNMPTMMNPAVLMLKLAIAFQKLPWRCSSVGNKPSTSMVPITKQMATDRPVMARL